MHLENEITVAISPIANGVLVVCTSGSEYKMARGTRPTHYATLESALDDLSPTVERAALAQMTVENMFEAHYAGRQTKQNAACEKVEDQKLADSFMRDTPAVTVGSPEYGQGPDEFYAGKQFTDNDAIEQRPDHQPIINSGE